MSSKPWLFCLLIITPCFAWSVPAYLQLRYLGATNVRLYNGGWSHWGNRPALPVVEGEMPYSIDKTTTYQLFKPHIRF